MKILKIRLKYFLLTCLLLGAVLVPVGWWTYQTYQKSERAYEKWKAAEAEKAAEIQRLQSEYSKGATTIFPAVTGHRTRFADFNDNRT